MSVFINRFESLGITDGRHADAESNFYFTPVPQKVTVNLFAELLNRKFTTSYEAFKALDLNNNKVLDENAFQAGLSYLGLSTHALQFD